MPDYKWRKKPKKFWLTVGKRYFWQPKMVARAIGSNREVVVYWWGKWEIPWRQYHEKANGRAVLGVSVERKKQALKVHSSEIEAVCANCRGNVRAVARKYNIRYEAMLSVLKEKKIDWKQYQNNGRKWQSFNSRFCSQKKPKQTADKQFLSWEELQETEYATQEPPGHWACEIWGV